MAASLHAFADSQVGEESLKKVWLRFDTAGLCFSDGPFQWANLCVCVCVCVLGHHGVAAGKSQCPGLSHSGSS